MPTVVIDSEKFKTLVTNGYLTLKEDMEHINSLNVFPVPDGDTGTNMQLTMQGGMNAVNTSQAQSIHELCKEMSRAMTLSARGNSGVILSQFFKGFYLGVQEKEVLDVPSMIQAFEEGVKQAYSVVQKPTEGTILTVMREATYKSKEKESNFTSFEDFFTCFLSEANQSLLHTPELLPVLKEAGVIDSGGAGYVKIIEGMVLALDGKILESKEILKSKTKSISTSSFNADSELDYGYCTEFILQLQNAKVDIAKFEVSTMTQYLETLGDSIVAFKDEDIVKIHIHTKTPGKVISFCQQFGEFVTFKMENMSVQHSEMEEIIPSTMEKEFKEFAMVAVSSGEGITNQFKEMNVDEIICGGQTMNPSTEDFIYAFEKIKAHYIYVFPNNSNIIMAANQAAKAYTKASIVVIPTTSVMQCFSALSMQDFSSNREATITENFKDCIKNVCDGSITYAIRDTTIHSMKVKKNDYIAFIQKELVGTSSTKVEAFLNLLSHVSDIQNKEVLTVFYGKDVKKEEIETLHQIIETTYPNLECGFMEGNQEVYSFLLSLE